MATRKKNGSRIEQALELAVGHDGATECDATNVGTEEESNLL